MKVGFNSNILGKLNQDKDIEEWLISEEVEIPFFDGEKLAFTFIEREQNIIDECDLSIENFLNLNSFEKFKYSDLLYQNCREFLEEVGYDESDKNLWEIQDKNEICNYVRPSNITVAKRHRRDCDIYIQVWCECDWEQEHGLQLVFRQGKKITRVSSQDGHLTESDAYDKPDEQDELLSKFNKYEI